MMAPYSGEQLEEARERLLMALGAMTNVTPFNRKYNIILINQFSRQSYSNSSIRSNQINWNAMLWLNMSQNYSSIHRKLKDFFLNN